MKYGKVIITMKDGSKETYNKVWRIGDIIKHNVPTKRICFFNGMEVIIKDSEIEAVVVE